MPNKVLPSASGYNVYGFLKSPVFAKGFISYFYPKSLVAQISETNFEGTSFKEGSEIVFKRAPRAELFSYRKNQELEVSSMDTTPITMTIKRGSYFNVKLDIVDKMQIDEIMKALELFKQDASEKLAIEIDRKMIDTMLREAAPCNKGNSAGIRTGRYNLGVGGAPVALSGANVMKMIRTLSLVLDEQNLPKSGRFIILPPEATLAFDETILNNTCASGLNKALILTEAYNIPQLAGFTVYFSSNMPSYAENGQIAYPIIAGLKGATGYVMQLEKMQHIDQDSRSFSEYWRGLWIYDWKVIRPEMLAAAYVTIAV
jgi:hypothetical protein